MLLHLQQYLNLNKFSRSSLKILSEVYLSRGESGNPFIHHFRAKFGDKAVENSPRRWINGGQRVENPLTSLLERAQSEVEHEDFEHKKREPLIGSLVADTTKYTRFLPKNQALAWLCSMGGISFSLARAS